MKKTKNSGIQGQRNRMYNLLGFPKLVSLKKIDMIETPIFDGGLKGKKLFRHQLRNSGKDIQDRPKVMKLS